MGDVITEHSIHGEPKRMSMTVGITSISLQIKLVKNFCVEGKCME